MESEEGEDDTQSVGGELHCMYYPVRVMGIDICSCADNGSVLMQGPHLSGRARWDICFSRFQLLFLHVCPHSSWFVKAAHVNSFSSAREFQVQNVHPFLKELVSHSFLHRQVLPASHVGTGSEVSPWLELSCSLEHRGGTAATTASGEVPSAD